VKRFTLVLITLIAVSGALWWKYHSRPGEVPTTDSAGSRLNVVLVTIDTLRADRLGRGLTPSIDALGASGTRFDMARSVVPLTLPSHVTIMTGALPAVHHVRENGTVFTPGPIPIARVLHDSGYRTAGFVGAYVLNRMFGLADGFDTYDDRVHRDARLGAQLEAERRGSEVIDAALGWLQTARPPFLLWAHLYDPHAPYEPPAEFLAKARGHAYDGEVAYADAQVGRLVAALRETGLLGTTVIALAGDHGEALGDHGEQSHGMLAYDSTLRVPLIVTGPGVAVQTIRRPVSLVHLAPTLLAAAGVRPAGPGATTLFSGDGRPEIYAETQYPRQAGWHALSALADERWKLILSSELELYDVSIDAGETTNLASAKASIAESMTKRLREIAASDSSAAPQPAIPPEAAERLRALGYVSSSPASNPTRDSQAENPAGQIDAWVRFERALSDVTRGRAADAIPVLKDLAERYPDALVFRTTYGRALKDIGRASAAVGIYKSAVRRWPGEASLYHDLAVAARAAGDAAEALRAEQAALTLDKESPEVLNGLGLLQAESGASADAAASFERAVARDPSSASYWTNLGNARRELGELDRSEQAYRKALEVDSGYADASNGLGVVLVQRKRPAEAIPFFQQALARDPALHEARLNLGIAYQESGDGARAAETYRQVLSSAPPASREWKAAQALLLKGKRDKG
jgi:arylsulfatase A-like enzyme/Flp pilus assembly protein TadD